MATCEVCGNEYDKTFEVRRNDETHKPLHHGLAPGPKMSRSRLGQ